MPPETKRATQRQLKEHTRLCGKIVGRSMGSGDKPIEPGDSWLSKTEFQFNLKFTYRPT